MPVKYSPKTFAKDFIARDDRGRPLGKVILPSDFDYSEGIDKIPVLLLRLPKVLIKSPLGNILYIDGWEYKVPTDIPKFRVNLRVNDWIVASFYLQRSDNAKA